MPQDLSVLVEAAGSASRVRKSPRQDFYERSHRFKSYESAAW